MLAWAPFCGVESSDLDVLLGVQFRNINFGGFIFVFLVTDSGDLGFLGFGEAQLSQNCSLLDFVKVGVFLLGDVQAVSRSPPLSWLICSCTMECLAATFIGPGPGCQH